MARQDWRRRLDEGRDALRLVHRPDFELGQDHLETFEEVCRQCVPKYPCVVADWLWASLCHVKREHLDRFEAYARKVQAIEFKELGIVLPPSTMLEFQLQYKGVVQRLLNRLVAETHPPLRSHRILVPTEYKGTGYLIWAEVTVDLLQENASPSILEVAPDTFYLPVGPKWNTVQSYIPATLTKLLGWERPRKLQLRLLPLGPEDLDHDGGDGSRAVRRNIQDRQWAAWLLSNPTLEIEGASPSLAVAIAAWAASEQLTVPPILASGAISPQGNITGVNKVPEKLWAMEDFRCLVRFYDRPIGIFPSNNQAEKPADVGEADLLWRADCLRVFEDQERLLTDGFDDYLRHRAKEAKEYRSAQRLRRPDPADVPGRQSLVLGFNDPPGTTAEEALYQLEAGLQSSRPKAARPIVLRVPVAGLGPGPTPTAADFPQALTGALLRRYAGLQLKERDVVAALRRQGKLALVVHDDPGHQLWGLQEEELQRRIDWFRLLWGLGGQRLPAEHWQQQHVFAVFSDRHHREWVLARRG
jgi:hypothetical protein